MIPQFPFYRQLGELDCGATCLKMIIDFFGKSICIDYLNTIIPKCNDGVSLKHISDAANHVGLQTLGVKINYDKMAAEIPTPCIAFWKKQHFVVVYHIDDEYVWIADPANRGIYVQSKETFQNGWICDKENASGILLLFETTPHFYESKNITPLQLSE